MQSSMLRESVSARFFQHADWKDAVECLGQERMCPELVEAVQRWEEIQNSQNLGI